MDDQKIAEAWLADPSAPDADPWNEAYYGYSLTPLLALPSGGEEGSEPSYAPSPH